MISIIVAVSDNLAIGRGGDMPWHIAADLAYFKQVTSGHTIVMGRRTWESIGCRPLKNRNNIVVSATLPSQEGATVVKSLQEALKTAKGEVFVIGGWRLYSKALSMADRLYLTRVHTVIKDADTFFPFINPEDWKLVSKSEMMTDVVSNLQFEFKVYDRASEQR